METNKVTKENLIVSGSGGGPGSRQASAATTHDIRTPLKNLAGKELTGFKVEEMTHVFRVNEDGRFTASIGYFKDDNIAQAFVENQTDVAYVKSSRVFVLTNGKFGYVVDRESPVILFDEEATVLDLKRKVIGKLSAAEQKIIGLGK